MDREILEILKSMQNDMKLMQNDMKSMQNDMKIMKSDISSMQNNLDKVNNRLGAVENKTDKNTMLLENLNKNIEVIAASSRVKEVQKELARVVRNTAENWAEIAELKVIK